MTLQDFIREHDRYSFVEHNLADMKEDISMMDTLKGKEFEDRLASSGRRYYTIYGYIIAVAYHGGIKEDECQTIIKELIGLSGKKEKSVREEGV